MLRKAGARGPRTILEETLLDTMYEIPSHEKKLDKVVVNEQFVVNKSKPFVVISNDSELLTRRKKSNRACQKNWHKVIDCHDIK